MLARLIPFPLVAATVVAQTTWMVPAGVTNLAPYIAQAAPGDTLLLAANPQYDGFVLNKGLTLIGPTNVGLLGGPPNPVLSNNTVQIVVPSGQRAILAGIGMGGSSIGGFLTIPARINVQGTASFEDIVINGGDVTINGDVLLQRCSVHAFAEAANPALRINGGTCVATDCSFRGASSITSYSGSPTNCTPGILQTGGTLHGSHLVVRGGNRNSFLPSGGEPSALAAYGGTSYLSDCSLQGGDGMPNWTPVVPGGHAVEVAGGNVAIARTTLIEGMLATGASTGYQVVPQQVGMSSSGAMVRGSSFTATATAGSSQELLGILAGFDATLATVTPIVEPLCGIPVDLICLQLALPSSGAGVAQLVAIPNVGTLLGAQVFLQAVQLDGAAIRASTVVGGTIR